MTQDSNITAPTDRIEWVEPSVHQLDVRETALNPGAGRDGNTTYADCTRS